MDETEQDVASVAQDGWAARWSGRLLALVVMLVGAAMMTAMVAGVIDRVRSDTPVRAVTVGEAGCVTGARFTDPTGASHLVDLRVYKANCLDRDPGEGVTVYYDADDPGTHAATRSWWWPALLTAMTATMTALGVRALWRGPVPVAVRPRSSRFPRRPRRRPEAVEQAAVKPASVDFLTGDDADSSYRWDYALQRTAMLLADVRSELLLPASERPSSAADGVLAALEHRLEAMLRCLEGAAVSAAREHARAADRLVLDGMDQAAPLARNLRGLLHQLSGRPGRSG